MVCFPKPRSESLSSETQIRRATCSDLFSVSPPHAPDCENASPTGFKLDAAKPFFPIQLAHENCLELQMDALPLALNIDGVEDNADHLGPAAEAGNSKNA